MTTAQVVEMSVTVNRQSYSGLRSPGLSCFTYLPSNLVETFCYHVKSDLRQSSRFCLAVAFKVLWLEHTVKETSLTKLDTLFRTTN